MLTQGGQREAPVVVRQGIIRIEPDGLIVIAQRALGLALGAEGETAAVVSAGIGGSDPDGLVIIQDA